MSEPTDAQLTAFLRALTMPQRRAISAPINNGYHCIIYDGPRGFQLSTWTRMMERLRGLEIVEPYQFTANAYLLTETGKAIRDRLRAGRAALAAAEET